MAKYITVSVSNITTQIAKETGIKGYTEGVIEVFFPDDSELEKWTDKQRADWERANNKRMKAICKFLNGNDL
jgi:hypothetical protein